MPISVFGIDRTDTGAPPFALRVVAGDPGPMTTTGGLVIRPPHGLDALDDAGVVVVPTWRDVDENPPGEALDRLREAHTGGATIVGLCLGAFVLAAAGLLDGRPATTHWRYAPALARRYPAIDVDASVLYVDDGDILTSAGTAAGIDACLHLVRREFGAEAAAAIARRMVVPPHRAGGQAQYVEAPVVSSERAGPFDDVMAYAIAHLDEDVTVEDLAERVFMSRRSFDRRFRDVCGTSPLQWLLHQRVLRAQQLLETTDLGIDVVAGKVGFSSGIALRPHFRRMVGVAPQAYRRAFRPGG